MLDLFGPGAKRLLTICGAPPFVIPAKAGTHLPYFPATHRLYLPIAHEMTPAFAGVTASGMAITA